MRSIIFYIFIGFLALFAQGSSHSGGITFALVGDIMLGSNYNDNRCPADGDVNYFEDAKQFLSAADVAIGNLEGPITTAENCTKNAANGRVYAFRMPENLAKALADAGFDVLNTANNHSNDFGRSGRIETEKILDSLEISHTGRFGDIAVVDVRGSKVAVIGWTINPGNFPLLDDDLAESLVRALDKLYDIVVVTFHGGAEGAEHLHLPKGAEMFLGENRGDLRKFSHEMIDAGADIVFGHGPHIPRAVEVYHDKLIAYSLGNFCTWYGINVRGVCGLAPMLQVQIDDNGDLLALDIISFEQQTHHYPKIDPDNRARELIIELSESDIGKFPFDLMKYAFGVEEGFDK